MSKPQMKPEHEIYYTGRKNIYGCPACKHKFATVDLLKGTTPFMLTCPACKDSPANSSFYGVPQAILPSQEFYKPDDDEYENMDPDEKEHVDLGGLLVRPVPDETIEALRAVGILTEKLPKVMVAHVDLDLPAGMRVKQEFI